MTLKDQEYQIIPDQVDKIVQLYETMKTRHTCMIIGPTGGKSYNNIMNFYFILGGKSVVIETLAKAQTLLGISTKLHIINPKAQTVNELYGTLDPNTRYWTDGLLSREFRYFSWKAIDWYFGREINKHTVSKDVRYIVFDGDVDTVWVENLNSVMDDNKLLTLPNAERIRLAFCWIHNQNQLI